MLLVVTLGDESAEPIRDISDRICAPSRGRDERVLELADETFKIPRTNAARPVR